MMSMMMILYSQIMMMMFQVSSIYIYNYDKPK